MPATNGFIHDCVRKAIENKKHESLSGCCGPEQDGRMRLGHYFFRNKWPVRCPRDQSQYVGACGDQLLLVIKVGSWIAKADSSWIHMSSDLLMVCKNGGQDIEIGNWQFKMHFIIVMKKLKLNFFKEMKVGVCNV